MAKKKVDPAAARANFSDTLAARLDAQRAAIDKDYGEVVRAMPQIGLRLPHLCQRFLLRMNILPFGRSYVLYGPPRSCKSAFLYELYRLFLLAGGYYLHLETEDKDQELLRRSLTRYPTHIDDSKWRHRADTMNTFQALYYRYTKWMRAECERAEVGRTVPFVVGVDSLVAKATERTVKAYEAHDGAHTPQFGNEANALSGWLKTATNHLHGWPFVLAGVNHDKPKKDNRGFDVHHAPGGDSQEFMATTRILMQRTGDLKRTAAGEEAQEVRLKADKNSASATGQQIVAEMRWFTDAQDNQQTWWDWDKATVYLLESLTDTDSKDATGQRSRDLRDALGLAAHAQGRYSCKALGVSKDDALPAAELGALLEQNAELAATLDRLLEVRQYRVWQPGVDLADVMAEAA